MISPAVTLLTARGPFADLVDLGQTLVNAPILNVSILPGFAPANASTNGMSIVVTADAGAADAPTAARRVAVTLAQRAWADRHRYKPRLTTLDDAVVLARRATKNPASPPIILADVADVIRRWRARQHHVHSRASARPEVKGCRRRHDRRLRTCLRGTQVGRGGAVSRLSSTATRRPGFPGRSRPRPAWYGWRRRLRRAAGPVRATTA